MLTLSPTQPPEAPSEQQITQDAARQMLAAPRAADFCHVLAQARHHKLTGYWSGSAYRHHPCGVIRRGIILCNEWSTFNYCYASVILDPESPIMKAGNDSWGHQDPHPRPERGGELKVYSSGSWSNEDGPWRTLIVGILADLRSEIADADAAQRAVAEEKANASRAAHEAVVNKARAVIFAAEGRAS